MQSALESKLLIYIQMKVGPQSGEKWSLYSG